MLDRYVKAVVAAIVAGAGAYGTAVADGHVTGAEWAAVVIAAVSALGLVWAAPRNADPVPKEPTQP